MHQPTPATTAIEDNAAGEAVRENLNLPPHQLIGFTHHRKASKARIIANYSRSRIQQLVAPSWDAEACPELDAEMRGYQLPDDNVVQDSVDRTRDRH